MNGESGNRGIGESGKMISNVESRKFGRPETEDRGPGEAVATRHCEEGVFDRRSNLCWNQDLQDGKEDRGSMTEGRRSESGFMDFQDEYRCLHKHPLLCASRASARISFRLLRGCATLPAEIASVAALPRNDVMSVSLTFDFQTFDFQTSRLSTDSPIPPISLHQTRLRLCCQRGRAESPSSDCSAVGKSWGGGK